MADKRQKWVVRNAEGLVAGPFTTEQILKAIRSGDLGGEEYISVFPGGKWRPISQDPQFYDYLLDAVVNLKPESIPESTINPTPIAKKKKGKVIREGDEPEPPKPEDLEHLHPSTVIRKTFEEDEEDATVIIEAIKEEKTESSYRPSDSKKQGKKKTIEDIELADVKKLFHAEMLKRAKIPGLVLLGV
ncbi:MAG: hypothetical protein KDD22_04385, partial [Bdellovibrionales bacterium]|nr:hypothetical protein [Bdellovibrionales bacterium]